MKYQNLELFKKHLKASFPHKLPNLYFVVVKDDYERLRVIDNITCYFPKNSVLSINRFSAESSSLQEVINTLDSPSLLGGESIVVVDGIDLYKRKEIQDFLTSYLKKNLLRGFLVLSAKDKKNLLTLFSEVDKRGVILDLSLEKIWEKEKRLLNFVIEKCAQSKKSISQDAKETLLSLIGLDMSSLENEIEKAALYVGDKHIIEKEDILAICSSNVTNSVWQIAEKVIWEDPFFFNIERDYCVDSIFFHSLVIALRYHLQEGLKLSSALENNLDIFKLFSNIRPNVLQKRKEKALFFGSTYFKEALKELFDIDMLSKDGISSFLFLIDLFRVKLIYLRRYENPKTYTSS